jgi:hypothetical protein
MKYYVIHNPKWTERKEKLMEQFQKFGIVPEWITSYPAEDMEILKTYTKSPMSLGYISGIMKHYDALQRLLDDDDEKGAIIFEDDVILTEAFDEECIPVTFPYVSLNMGPPGDQLEKPSRRFGYKKNNGGAEAYYVNKMFASVFLQNVTLSHGIDLEYYRFLYNFTGTVNIPWVPMCYQNYGEGVSLSSSSFVQEEMQPWQDYVLKSKQTTYTFKKLRELCTGAHGQYGTLLDKNENGPSNLG